MVKILHILPQNGIGGAELAACRAASDREEVAALFLARSDGTTQRTPNRDDARIRYGQGQSSLGPGALRSALRAVDALAPEVVVFSMWRTFGAFLALRLLRPQRRFVLFLHSERATHFVDLWATRTMARLSHGVFADSGASLRRLHRPQRIDTRVVSFMMRRLQPLEPRDPAPRFIFWGRLQALKDLPRALRFFAVIASRNPEAELRLIGPDGGMRSVLEAQVVRLGIEHQVSFDGPRSFDEIVQAAKGARFFLQLSSQEGMAMSVVEAMQLGLVVIVTPVGEIASYCNDMDNGV
ncbi:MAG: glycosyltransferase family 4 protein, partial [Acidobacteriota bacterium]